MKGLALCCILALIGQALGDNQPTDEFIPDGEVKLEDVKDVTSFNALFVDSEEQPKLKRGMIHFVMWIDAGAMPAESTSRYPLLDIYGGGKLLATVPVAVDGPTNDGDLILEWSVSPEVDARSRVALLLHPGTDNVQQVAIPLSEAECVFVDNERNEVKLSYAELQAKAKEAMSNVR